MEAGRDSRLRDDIGFSTLNIHVYIIMSCDCCALFEKMTRRLTELPFLLPPQEMGYPPPDYYRSIIPKTSSETFALFFSEVQKASSQEPLYVLIWGEGAMPDSNPILALSVYWKASERASERELVVWLF